MIGRFWFTSSLSPKSKVVLKPMYYKYFVNALAKDSHQCLAVVAHQWQEKIACATPLHILAQHRNPRLSHHVYAAAQL